MTKVLTDEGIERFRSNGYYFPIRALSPEEAQSYRQRLEASESAMGGPLLAHMRHKVHLLFTWANELVHCSTVLDAVEDLLGPHLLCWTTDLFVKEPHSKKYVSWHQDSTYWSLEPQEIVSAWLALDDVPVESGALRFLPGSHRLNQIPHVETFREDNILSRGQAVDMVVDDSKVVDVPLKAGQISLHHGFLVHGSMPNATSRRRVGLAIRYVPTHVKRVNIFDSAMLVRGRDEFGNFDLEPEPRADLDVAAQAAHGHAIELMRRGGYPGHKMEERADRSR